LLTLHLHEKLLELRGIDVLGPLSELRLDAAIDSQQQPGPSATLLLTTQLAASFLVGNHGDHRVDQFGFEPGWIWVPAVGRVGGL
jgi:hypothetical protein